MIELDHEHCGAVIRQPQEDGPFLKMATVERHGLPRGCDSLGSGGDGALAALIFREPPPAVTQPGGSLTRPAADVRYQSLQEPRQTRRHGIGAVEARDRETDVVERDERVLEEPPVDDDGDELGVGFSRKENRAGCQKGDRQPLMAVGASAICPRPRWSIVRARV